jgi:hypothetical protein
MIDEALFAPTRTEEEFSADDWAWQFLRLSSKYKEAYRRACKQGLEDEAFESIKSCMIDPSGVSIARDSSTVCAQEFGLSAWLAPEHEELPRLKNDGSWFFPLRRIIQEDPRLVEVGAIWPYETSRGLNAKQIHPRLIADETPFGYRSIKLAHRVDTPHRERMVWAAIDCSVPLEGQMLAFKALAKLHRAYWRKNGLQTSDRVTVEIESVDYDDIFSHVRFRRTHNSGLSQDSSSLLWRTVGIDALGPITIQIEDCSRRLRAIHYDLRMQSLLESHWPQRFPRDITGVAGSSGKAPESSRYLKALLVLAKAIQPTSVGLLVGEEAEQIARILDIYPRGFRFPQWLENFYEGMGERHLPRAHNMIKKRYRWLVHAQIMLERSAPLERRQSSPE